MVCPSSLPRGPTRGNRFRPGGVRWQRGLQEAMRQNLPSPLGESRLWLCDAFRVATRYSEGRIYQVTPCQVSTQGPPTPHSPHPPTPQTGRNLVDVPLRD